MPTSSNKRIAKNTLYLYLRKFFNIGINIYISRILLQTLGFDDYGLYGVVGSVIMMFSALRGLFSSSIQRYINIAKGENSTEQINLIFNIGVKVHLLISVIFLVAAEIGGFIMIPNLNIPAGNETTALWILQFSILSAIVSIMTVPYDAIIIANERFNAYAILSIAETLLKLGVIFLLLIMPFNRVVTYAFLLFAVQLIIRSANAVYCRHSFREEVKLSNTKNHKLFKEMSTFAGWQFLGNFAWSMANAGVNFVLNIFGGVVANAARAITYQVISVIQNFTGDLSVSFTPQITQNFHHDRARSYTLAFFNSKVCAVVSLVIVYPFLCNSSEILHLWLGKVPEYTDSFVRMVMLYVVIRCVHSPIDALFKAFGNIRQYQTIELIILISNVPISWMALKFGLPLYSVFAVMAILEFINLIFIVYLARNQFGFDLMHYFKHILARVFLAASVLAACYVLYATYFHIGTSLWNLIVSVISNVLIAIMVASSIILSREEFSKLLSNLPIHHKL